MLLLKAMPSSLSFAGVEITFCGTFSRDGCGNAGYAGTDMTMNAKAANTGEGIMAGC